MDSNWHVARCIEYAMVYLRVIGRKYDQFGGRAGRREFWLFMLVHVILLAATRVLDFVVPLSESEWYESGPIYPIYWLIAIVPVLALVSRRLHDTGRSGWYQALVAAWVPTVAFGGAAADFVRDGTDAVSVVLAMFALVFLGAALVGTLMLFIFALLPGEGTENRYGLPAESPDRPAVFWTVLMACYAKFNGRASRKEFWLFVLVCLTVTLIARELDQWLLPDLISQDSGTGPVTLVFVLAAILPTLSLAARRVHDVGLSAWWLLLLIPPITPVGLICIVTLAIVPGREGENKHGQPAVAPA